VCVKERKGTISVPFEYVKGACILAVCRICDVIVCVCVCVCVYIHLSTHVHMHSYRRGN